MKNILLLLIFSAFYLPVSSQPPSPKPPRERVVIGAEQLLSKDFLHLITGKRIGVITNHTGLLPDGRHIVDILHSDPAINLTTLFGPEHGIRGDADHHVADGKDAKTGLPVISLYGKVRKPTPEILENIDVLIFDIQDVGARYYTYIATMKRSLDAAAENNKEFIVLDRPNAIGGVYVDGPVGNKALEPVSEIDHIPVVHGMTVGELALMFNQGSKNRGYPAAKLTVIPMKNYSRDQWYDETGLPWIKPSPNMLTLTTATVYPGTCLLEGTNISEARGTLHPFERIGAPWIDSELLTQQLNSYHIAGVTFQPVRYVPDSLVDGIKIYPPKFMHQQCYGSEMIVTDREAFQSVQAGIYILHALHELYPQDLTWREGRLDGLLRTSTVREQLIAGKTPEEIISQWEKELDYFKEVRAEFLLY